MVFIWGFGMVSVVGFMGFFVVLFVGGCVVEEFFRFIKEFKDQIGVFGGVVFFVC